MCAKLIKSNPNHTAKWSGGETTELFIHPNDSSYKERDFDYRLSTATVEDESTVFTPLQGVRRVLMVLDGKMELCHDGEYSVLLSRFDVDRFEGGWATRSFGRCVDFNLMLRNGVVGMVRGVELSGDSVSYDFNDRPTLFFYAFDQSVVVELNGEHYKLEQGDLLVVDEGECFDITLAASVNTGVVVVEVL